ncbi:MAG: DEAD/DEAH box helicase [Candidatus Norongarragalinales archaeon]
MNQLRPEVLRLARAKGFTEWTEIQEKAIPLVLQGKNVLAIAPTGFGKSEVAFLPILSQILHAHDAENKKAIKALYITPLRALNRDMLERLESWCVLLGISLAVRHGDTTQAERKKQRDKPAEIFVTTPETLQSMLVAPVLSDALANVRFVVIDEVHELADSKRGLQLSLGLERLREKTKPNEFQVIGLSATVGNEEEVARFLAKDAIVVKSDVNRAMQTAIECPLVPRTTEFEGIGLAPENKAKLERIKQLIETHNRTLLFVNTRYVAESLSAMLFESPAMRDNVAVHHSSLSRETRVETEKEFKKFGGRLRAIVCTSSLELGIDVGQIDLAIQFSSPRQATRFLQRTGRSGHRKHLTPKGIVIPENALDCFEAAVIVDRARRGLLEPLEIRRNALDVLAHQLAGLTLDYGEIPLQRAHEIIKRAMPFVEIEIGELAKCAAQLHDARCVWFDGATLRATPKTRLYYYENLSTIRDTKKFFVKDATTRKTVGTLDEEFVAEYLGEGATFIARGRAWRVLSVTEKEVLAEPTRDLSAAVPEWVGEEIPVSRSVAEEVAGLLAAVCEKKIGEKEFAEKYNCSEEAYERMKRFATEQSEFFVPRSGANEVVFESNRELVAMHCFLGTKANETLGRALAALLTAALGAGVRVKTSAYGCMFECGKPLSAKRVAQYFRELRSRHLISVLKNVVPNTALFRKRFIGVAKAFGIVSKKSELREIGVRRLAEALSDSPVFEEALAEVFFDKMSFEDAGAALDADVRTIEERGRWSPLAREFFDFGAFSELMAPAEPSSQVVQAFKEELFAKRPRLYCVFCGKSFGKTIGEAEQALLCPYCGSNRLTLEDYREVIEKKKRGRELDFEERRKHKEAFSALSIISSYGRRGLLALETFGVGPWTARRVLARLHSSEDELVADLLEEQKRFLRTKGYWKI